MLPSLMAFFQTWWYLMLLRLYSLNQGILQESEHSFLKKVAFILLGGFENSQIGRQERMLHIPFGKPEDFFLQPRGFSALIHYFWKFGTADNMSVHFRCCPLSQTVPTGWSVCQRRVFGMHLLQCMAPWDREPLLRISGTTTIKIINKRGISFYPEMLV